VACSIPAAAQLWQGPTVAQVTAVFPSSVFSAKANNLKTCLNQQQGCYPDLASTTVCVCLSP
jgi:hypothetical protein